MKNRRILRFLVLLVLYLFTSGLSLNVFLLNSRFGYDERANFRNEIGGQAYRPWVYRTLVPTTIRFVARVTPAAIQERIEAGISGSSRPSAYFKAVGWDLDFAYEYLLAVLIWLSCLVGFCFALRRLVRLNYQVSVFVEDFAPLFAVLALTMTFVRTYTIYDFATLLLWTLAILFIEEQRMIGFYSVFILACINKETAFLLGVIFLIRAAKSLPRPRMYRHLAVQGTIWIAVRYIIMSAYQANPGGPFEFQGWNNIAILFHPARLIKVLPFYLAYGLLVRHDWRQKPPFLRSAFLATFVPFVVFFFFVGVIDELRIFYEVFPLILLLSLPSFLKIFDPKTGGAGSD